MDDTTKAKLGTNASNAYKMASNWVMTAAGVLGTVWFAMPEDQRQTIIAHSPLPVWTYPIVLTVLGIVARIWPQSSITPAAAAAKSADAPQPPAGH